jgi:uncharacterized membrane protein
MLTWRICASLTTVILVFIFTKSWTLSLSVGVVEALTKSIVYYLHERVWSKNKWGIFDE